MSAMLNKAMKKAGFVAREICMAGFKEVPIAGKVVEVIESVQARRESLAMGDQMRAMQESMTGMERRVRDAARLEIESVLAGFRAAGLDAAARDEHIRNFRAIQKHGWSPALFQGLLQNSPEWDNLCRNPQDYGQVLSDQDVLNPAWVHVFIDADKTRVLQMPPQMFGIVLSDPRAGADAAPTVVCTQDVWAFAPQGPPAGQVVAPPEKKIETLEEALQRVEKLEEALRPARVVSAAPPAPRRPSAAEVLQQRLAMEEEQRRQAKVREEAAQAERQRKLDAEYAGLHDVLARQLSAGHDAEAARTLLALEALRPPDDDLRAMKKFLQDRVPQCFPRRAFTNSVGMKFVEIFPGSFLMGSPANEPERGDSETQHKVTLTRGFWLGVHQVTQAQWQAVMGSNPAHFKGESLPVENVSWDDCQAFCQKLSQKEGKQYTLPTEAQWEYACRAGTTTPFHFGATISTDQANYDGHQVYNGGKKGVYRGKTTPVGSFPANPWGLHDMHGNVWEWCADAYGPYPAGEQLDPLAESSGASRVLRGGSWDNSPRDCRCAYRIRIAPDNRDSDVGFRCLLDFQ